MAILSLGEQACLKFWGSLEDAKDDCAAVAAAAGADTSAGADFSDGAASSSGVTGGSSGCCEDKSSGNITTTSTDNHACQNERQAQKKVTARRRAVASVRCEDCSLVVFEGQAYHDAWHGIASTAGNSSSSSCAATAVATAAATAAPPPPPPAVAAPSAQVDSMGGDGDGRDGAEGTAQKRLSFTIRRVARVIPADAVMEHPEARSEMERRRRGFERSVTETGVAAGAPAAAAAALT